MALGHAPSIVTNGLVFYIDAANPRCYPGSGTDLTDNISGISASLAGGVGFSTANYGTFTFDGSNDNINFGNSDRVKLLNGTISAWVKASSPGAGFRGIIAKQNAYGLFYNDSILAAYDWGAGGGTRSTGINIADGSWKNVAMSFQSAVSNGTKIYINGVSVLTTTMTWLNDTQNLYGGAEVSAGQYANCSGSIFSLYNRALSASEVLQNYNAARKRYGL